MIMKNFYTNFITRCFNSFYKHSDFAKILMKEQTQSFNKELIVKMHIYNQINGKNYLIDD